jgi:hypothetical protein
MMLGYFVGTMICLIRGWKDAFVFYILALHETRGFNAKNNWLCYACT